MESKLYRKTKWLHFTITERKPKTLVLHVFILPPKLFAAAQTELSRHLN